MKKIQLIKFSGLLNRHRKKFMIMKCCCAFIIMFCMNASGVAYSQTGTVSLELSDVGVEKFLEEVKGQTEFRFLYNSELVREAGTVSINVKEKALADVLDMVLGKVNLEYEVVNDVILIRQKSSQAQQPASVTIAGTVSDASGQPLIGATVMVKGELRGVTTDAAGKYAITIPAGQTPVLVFSFIGKTTVEIPYTGQATINATLKDDVAEIDEVVVNGYFTRKKESYTGVATTFSGEELKTVSTGNVLSTLSILDPSFVQVVNNEMGSDPNHIPDFEIRGSSSLKSEYQGNPNMPTFMMDGFEVSAQKVFDLDPNRIKFITILKDAAATAIYGSRAANGIVVIETELPKAGGLQISYNGSLEFEVADLSGYDLMNAEEKLRYEVQAGLYKPSSKPGWTEDTLNDYNQILRLVKEGNDVDWLSIPVRELGIGQKHSVMAEGGSNNFRYAIDLFYSNRMGAMKGSKRDNYGGSIRLQYNWKNLKFTNYTSFDHLLSVNSPYGQFSNYLYYNPYYNPYDENGNVKRVLYTYRYYDRGFLEKTMNNELYNAVLPSKNQAAENHFLNNFAVEYDIIDGLKLKANLSLSVDNGATDIYKPYEHTDFLNSEYKGSYFKSNTNSFSYDINVILSYFKAIGKHYINVGAVYNVRETNSDMASMLGIGFPNANMDHISMATKYQEGKPGGIYDITRLVGFVGNGNYTYDNRFLLDLSIRSDGSSLYGVNNRWSTFWSAGIGWNLHNEKFLKDSRVINLLKIRGSIGTTGGQNFNPYQSMAMYSYNDPRINSISYAGYNGAILMAFGNRNLKWQRVEKQNIGLDFELLDRRLSGSFNVYKDVSKDVLINVTIAPSLGFDSYMENLGKVQNSGVELTLRGAIIRNAENRLRWDLLFNMAHNKNKVLEINKALTAYNDKQDSEVKSRPTIRYQEGLPQNTIWANESLGIDPATGDEIFLDKNGNKTKTWSVDNYKPFHSSDPVIFGTFGTVLSYRNWELNAHLYYRYGGYIYNQTLVDKVENVDPNENGDRRILYDRWKEPGDVAQYRRIPSDQVITTYPTSRFIEKENYIQLKSLSISYDLDQRILDRWGINRLKISAITNDLFTISTVKMERGTSYPFSRTFSLAVQITF